MNSISSAKQTNFYPNNIENMTFEKISNLSRKFTKEPSQSPPKQIISHESSDKSLENSVVVPQVRTLPPISLSDTVIMNKKNEMKSVHGSGELFCDEEIEEKLGLVKQVEIGQDIFVGYTKHGKAIIQQQAMRGCTAATAAMLIIDHGKKIDLLQLRRRNLGNDEDQIRDIKTAGLKPVNNSASTLLELRKLLVANGSAIVSVNKKLGGHVVVVDDISEDLSRIRLRDPYHGWEITVNSEAFLKEWNGGKAIQII